MTFRASAGFTQNWEHFDLVIADGVATIRFTRPDRLNALTFGVYADLRDVFTELPHRDDVAAVLIAGSGRGFCSGGDVHEIIGELVQMETRELLDFTRMTGAVVQLMREVPLPIVAAVNGVAAGAGAVLALAADLRILATSASFRFLFTSVGLSGADMGVAYLLPRVIGLGRATEVLLFGEKIDAAHAERIGLANQVVSDEDLEATARAVAQRLADGPTMAYAATKTLLTREQDMSLAGAIELEAMTQALLMTTHDHREFYEAFRDKRIPQWRGR
jgi:enoyl-CoA hydratase/carnithine racemase